MEAVRLPDAFFYYALCLMLASVLVWVILRYVGKIDDILERFEGTISKLSTLAEVQQKQMQHLEHRQDNIEEEISRLRDAPKVVYKP